MSRETMKWRKGYAAFHRGEMIYAIEESGRQFWAVRLNGEWRLRQEFCSVADAMDYIDEQIEAGYRSGETANGSLKHLPAPG